MAADYANARTFLGVLQGLGVPRKTALGALGSIAWESGPTLRGDARNAGDGRDGSDSIGWGQWNGSRGASLRNIAGQMGTSWSDPAANAAQIKAELTGPYSHVLKKLQAVDDTRAGTSIWTNDYEVPAVKNVDQRYGRALELGKQIDPNADYTSAMAAPTAVASTGPAAAPQAAPQAQGLLGSLDASPQAQSAKDQVLAMLQQRQPQQQALQLAPMQAAPQQQGGLLALIQQLQGAA